MDESTRKAAKRRASKRAVETVTDGDMVGLGSGSTAEHAIRLLGQKVADGLDIIGVPTSFQAREVATEVGIELTTLEETEGRLDVAIDGADQFAGSDLIKGGGAAHAREKIVDGAAEELVIVVDPTKRADVLDAAIPVEILPDARRTAADAIHDLDGEPILRRAERKSGPVVTDNGNLIFDCDFGEITDPAALASALSVLPGVVENGLCLDFADVVYLGTETGVERIEP
ncbi:ribose-5-phosphate isomerase RpiA [Halorhabdus salina]|uniref:ribose-5-phosphate isomerase RpiA n=1 Tax=Halorhabdus salina TaxID=2750670 RepID=UPI0015EF7B9E|nr:ribose-5-phosphate isomerase RpiA [Halorhabdus salina]